VQSDCFEQPFFFECQHEYKFHVHYFLILHYYYYLILHYCISLRFQKMGEHFAVIDRRDIHSRRGCNHCELAPALRHCYKKKIVIPTRRRKKVGTRKNASGADECRTLTPACRYRLSASAGVAWSMTRAIEMTFHRTSFHLLVSNFFSRLLVGHFDKLE